MPLPLDIPRVLNIKWRTVISLPSGSPKPETEYSLTIAPKIKSTLWLYYTLFRVQFHYLITFCLISLICYQCATYLIIVPGEAAKNLTWSWGHMLCQWGYTISFALTLMYFEGFFFFFFFNVLAFSVITMVSGFSFFL